MKTSFARFGLACALALTLSPAIAKAENVAAKVTQVKGLAEYSTDGQKWQPVTRGAMLPVGAVIRTAAGAHVDVLLSATKTVGTAEPVIGSLIYFPESGSEQANMVRVMESSVLSIDTLSETKTGMNAASETQLDLRKGSIFFSVKKLAAGSSFEMKCPKGIAGIRGSLGYFNSDGVVRLLRGIVAETYRGPDGVTTKTQVINARQTFDPNTGLLQGMDDGMLRGLLRIAVELTRGLAPVLPTTFIIDPNILVISNITGESPGMDYDYDNGGGSENSRPGK